MSLKDLVDQVKIKDRDKFAGQVQEYMVQARSWLQEHGEWALVVGILVGVVFVLFFKLIIVLLVVGGLASYVIWELSTPPNPTLPNSILQNVDMQSKLTKDLEVNQVESSQPNSNSKNPDNHSD